MESGIIGSYRISRTRRLNMIKKIICWIFGHEIIKYKKVTNDYGYASYEYEFNVRCPRCGAKLGD